MRKVMTILVALILCAGLAAGCSDKQRSAKKELDEAIFTATKYKEAELGATYREGAAEVTPDQYKEKEEQIRPYATASYFQKRYLDRVYALPLQVAFIKKSDLKLDDIKFQQKSVTDNRIDLSYDVVVDVVGDGKIPLSGTIVLQKEEGGDWLVMHDHYPLKPFIDIINEHILNRNS
ncbi:hypothetical protein ACFQZE_19165 [Paenibacillus sp. GCM10027627]|uniref:hypothetical protein n=1 Tax=unclassified Paenibacillus TaxID=185978 RepID=UPI00363794B2